MLTVTGLGRLTKEPELRFTPGGAGVVTMSIAFDTTWNAKEGKMNTTFLNVVVWNRGENKQAERCANYLAKGSQIVVEGTIQVRNYEAKDGSKKYITELLADKVHFVGAKQEKQEKQDKFAEFGQVVDMPDWPELDQA